MDNMYVIYNADRELFLKYDQTGGAPLFTPNVLEAWIMDVDTPLQGLLQSLIATYSGDQSIFDGFLVTEVGVILGSEKGHAFITRDCLQTGVITLFPLSLFMVYEDGRGEVFKDGRKVIRVGDWALLPSLALAQAENKRRLRIAELEKELEWVKSLVFTIDETGAAR